MIDQLILWTQYAIEERICALYGRPGLKITFCSFERAHSAQLHLYIFLDQAAGAAALYCK